MAEDAIQLVIADSIARGEPLPADTPSRIREVTVTLRGMNQKLPVVTAREVIRALERAGSMVSRMSGSHCRLIHASDPARKVTVPVHSGDLERGTLRAIVAQAGFTVAEFLELL